jgi:polyribonucleotide nucleotidyltransferase
MKPEATEITVSLAGGKQISFETGKLAKQAGGAAVVRLGDNVVLATATANADPREGIDFFPLTVDYREYTYAGGRFPGGFIKREGRMSEREVLTSRQIDRPVRPMFAEGFKCETQVIAFVLSADTDNDPDVCGINAASCALTLSDIPFLGPIGAVRVGLVNGQFIVNPTYTEMRESLLNIMVVGSAEAIVMIESGAKEVKEETVVDAIEFGHNEIKKICAGITELQAKAGKKKRTVEPPKFDDAYYNDLKKKVGKDLAEALDTQKHPKAESYTLAKELKKKLQAEIPEDDKAALDKLKQYYEVLRERIFREQVIENKRRPDARAFDEVRPIWIEAGILPRTHGSAIFTRGETQALVTATLGTSDDMQRLEGFEGEAKKRFMLHYNFPPFSVGEVGFMRGAGRREIGHGALAERALSAVLPAEDKWPYAMRVVSDILESNGSSSMATVCGASLSLMDAGVPLKSPVAGVAMGLVKEGDNYAILTDIAGAEDHYGDMDFKVAGTKDGITALQMDIKVAGITPQIMREALAQAQRGRMHILGKMEEVISSGREKISDYALLYRADSGRQDSRPDWAGRQDDSQHRRADWREDRRGRLRAGESGVERSGIGGEGFADYRRHHGDCRSWKDLSWQGDAAGGFRGVRGNSAGNRWTAAHQRSGGASHCRRARRVEGRRSSPGESACGRGQSHPAFAQGDFKRAESEDGRCASGWRGRRSSGCAGRYGGSDWHRSD